MPRAFQVRSYDDNDKNDDDDDSARPKAHEGERQLLYTAERQVQAAVVCLYAYIRCKLCEECSFYRSDGCCVVSWYGTIEKKSNNII